MNISVIIPTYNEYHNLIALKDFFTPILQTENIEIIVADSIHSTDQIESIGAPFTYIKSSTSGRSSQMNLGAKLAKGDILVFLHADVRPPMNFVHEIKNAINEGYRFGFFAYRFEPSSFMLDFNASFTGKKGIFVGGGDQIHFMHKTIFNKLGGYDEQFEIMEDFDFFRRFKKSNNVYKIIQEKAIVSSRKYNNTSWIRVNFANLVAFLMFHIGVDSGAIKKTYYRFLG